MNLSTSNSKFTARALGLLVLMILSSEILVRQIGVRFSEDLHHIDEIPEIVASLRLVSGYKVLFLGNSLTKRGIVTSVVQSAAMDQHPGTIAVSKICPNDTSILEWVYILKHFIANQGHNVDLLVIPFAGSHLEDQPVRFEDSARIGQSYISVKEIPEAFSNDFIQFDDRIDLVLSTQLASYANRERFSRRILNRVIPKYKTGAQWVHGTPKEYEVGHKQPQGTPSYERLARFAKIAEDHKIKIIWLAMPILNEYQIPDELNHALAATHTRLIDARSLRGLSEQLFLDSLHLKPEGAILVSDFVGKEIRGVLQSSFPGKFQNP